MFDNNVQYEITLTNNSGVDYREWQTGSNVAIGQTLVLTITGENLANTIMSNVAQHNSLRGRTEIVANAVALGGSSGDGETSYPSLTDNAGKVLTVNTTEDGVEWKTVSSGGSGGGASAINVIEYDATDPVNQIVTHFTLADFAPVDESAVIVGNTFKPNTDSSKWLDATVQNPYAQDIQYCAIKLNNVPTSGSISIDYSNHDDYCIALVTMNSAQQLTLQYIVENYLFQGFSTQGTLPSYDLNIVRNAKSEDTSNPEYSSDGLEFKWALRPPEMENRRAETISFDFADISSPVVFKYETALDKLMHQIGVTTVEELIQYAKDNGFYNEAFVATMALYAKQPSLFNEALLANSYNNFLPLQATDTYLILCPIYDNYWDANRDPLLLDANWTASVEVNATKVTAWKLPELTGDTYLKIKGSCELLGHSLTTGDTLYVYEDGTKALKFRG